MPARLPFERTACTGLALALLIACAGCEREERALRTPPSEATTMRVAAPTADSTPVARPSAGGSGPTAPALAFRYSKNSYAVSEGKRLYKLYNCSGCHAQGGGGSGPALMDDIWIYGAEPESVFATIVWGRPNGMPAFGSRIPEYQVWQLVAYVRSMTGLIATDAAPGRSDALQAKPSEQLADTQPPRRAVPVPDAEQRK